MKKLIYLFLFIGIVSCLSKNGSKPEVASAMFLNDLGTNGLKIDEKLLSMITKDIDKKPELLNREVWNYDKDGTEEHYTLDEGLIFKFVEELRAHSIFNVYHDKVLEGGNYLFLTNLDFDDSYNSYYDIIIIKGSDPFKLIELIGTQGINYDLYTDDIVNQLKEWDKQVEFKFVVIDESRIHAYMNKLPNDLEKFTSGVYEFCPDVIDQGYESMDEMISDYRDTRYFWLWWD